MRKTFRRPWCFLHSTDQRPVTVSVGLIWRDASYREIDTDDETSMGFLFSRLAVLSIPAFGQPRRKVIIDQDAAGPGGSNLQAIMVLVQSPKSKLSGSPLSAVTSGGTKTCPYFAAA